MAERWSHSSGGSKPPLRTDPPVRVVTLRPGRRSPPPANDNKAPLPVRLRRLLPLFLLLLGLALLLGFTGGR